MTLSTLLAGVLIGGGACTPEPAAETGAADEHAEEGGEQAGAGRVTLTEAALANAGIEVAVVLTEQVSDAAASVQAPARVELAPDRVALISPRTSGRIERLLVVEGVRVEAGAPVAEILSPAFLTAQNDFVQAARRAQVLAGSQDEAGARALLSAAERRLQLLGAPADLISRLQSGGAPLDLLPIPAPFAGSIIDAHALAGAAVEPGTPIFEIADLSVVEVVADVPEQSLSHFQVGRSASIRLTAYPERSLTGRIIRLSHRVDPSTRTLEVVIQVSNTQELMRAGMFATVSIEVPVAGGAPAATSALTIPSSAVVTDGADRFVFVEVGERTFERRLIEALPVGDGTRLAVRAGLSAGERVVVAGAFTLKSELAKGAFGEHGH
jgi:RND family efflux transporter MFP subunit